MNNGVQQITMKEKKTVTWFKVLIIAALFVALTLLTGGFLFYYFLHILDVIGKEQALTPNPPKPLVQTKKYMPQIIKDIYIGMSVDEFNKVAPKPVDESWPNRAEDRLASFYGPSAGFTTPNPKKGELLWFLFNFIIINEEEKKASLASVEATGKLHSLNEGEIVELLKNEISHITTITGVNPHLGLWTEKEVWREKKKNYGTKLSASIIWINKDAVVVISFPCEDMQCNIVYWRWAVYDVQIFERRIGKFLDQQRVRQRFYWEKDTSKIDSVFSARLLSKIVGRSKTNRQYYNGEVVDTSLGG
jgi:hypothetical protein